MRRVLAACLFLGGLVAVVVVTPSSADARTPRKLAPKGCQCGPGKPDVTLHLVSTVHDYPIGGTNATYRVRTFCDGSKPAGQQCTNPLPVFGPVLALKPGQRLRVMVENKFDHATTSALGPTAVKPEDWFPLLDDKNGRYAGMQSCGFVFTGKAPASPDELVQDKWNMPGNEPGMYDVTNLHLHGLEIMPHIFDPIGTLEPTAKLVRVQPGECQCFDVDLRKDHPGGGTYWYHPHMHSAIAIQAWSGMASLITVKGQLDQDLADIGVKQDLPFVICDPHFRELDQLETRDGITGRQLLGPRETLGVDYFLRDQTDASQVLFLVNAQSKPTFTMQPGELVRFRVLCATAENLAGFEILDEVGVAQPFWLVGGDGVVHSPEERTRLVLAGGQREEVLVQLTKPGEYRVVSRGLSKVQFFCTGPDDTVLALLRVTGSELKPVPISAVRVVPPKAPIRPEEIVMQRHVVLSLTADRSRVPFPQFRQNGKAYNEAAVEFRVKAGTAEEWILSNPDRTMHPFHVHVTPFQVRTMSSGYMTENPAMQEILRLNTTLDNWRDTVIVPAMGYSIIWIRWPEGHTGKTVAHCHFLAHEDTGMIMNILIE